MDVVVGGTEPVDPTIGERREQIGHGLLLVVGPGDVARVGRDQQRRAHDPRCALQRAVRIQLSQDRHVAVESEPRTDRPVGAHLEVGECPADPLLGPVGVRLAHPLLHPERRGALEVRWAECCGALLPGREAAGEFDEPTVDGRHGRHRVRMPGRQFEHDVAAPRLAGHDGPCPPESGDQRHQIGGHGRHVVAVIGGVGATVTALVDGHDRVAGRSEVRGHTVPESGVRRQPVHQQDRSASTGRSCHRAALDDVQGHTLGNGQRALALVVGRARGRHPDSVSESTPACPPLPGRGTRPVGGKNAPVTDDLQRRIVRMAVPALGTLAVEPVYVLVDTAIVGRLGTPQLAGLAIASIILLNVVSLLAFLEYVTPDIAHAVGAGDLDTARRTAAHGAWLSVVIGLPVGLLVAAAARPLCWLVGGRGEILDHATTYLSISALGLPFVLIAFLGHGVLRGHFDMRTPLVIVVVANVANLVLEIIAVYGLDLGVAGSAWSTVVVQGGAAIAFLLAMRRHLTPVRPSWAAYRPLLRKGVHMGIRSIAMYTVWNASTVIAAHLDAPTLAANQVVTQLFMFLALLLDSLAIPLHSLVAAEIGAERPAEAARIGTISIRLSVWAALGLGVVLAAASPWLPWLFSADGAVRSRITATLLVLAVMQIPGAIAFALDGALIGAHDMSWLGRQAVRNLVAFAPLAVATLVWPRLGLTGLWGAQACWMTMRAVVNWRRWHRHARLGFADCAPAPT